MTQDPARNIQTGEPVAQSADDGGATARAEREPGVHFEADADQIVKVVHQVRPESLPLQGPTDFDDRQGAEPGVTDVAVTPEGPSVLEARPADGEG